MDYEQRFTLHMEDHGSFLHISIPGKAPGVHETQTIRWTAMGPFLKSNELTAERAQFKRELKRQGLLKNLPEKIIPGYAHSYAYEVRFAVPYEICTDLNNLAYIRNDVSHVANHMLWFPLMKELEGRKDQYDHILIEVPVFPKVVTESFYDKWYENNQRATSFVKRLRNSSAQTRIHRTETDREIILKVKNHPFEEQPTQRVLLDMKRILRQPTPLSDEAAGDMKRRVLSRDAYLLRGLDDNPRKCFARGQDIPLSDAYELHWKRWLSLSGKQERNNVIVVPKGLSVTYRMTVQAPVECYLDKNYVRLAQAGKDVYLDIPLPMAHYRDRPIARRCCSKRQNRYALNRQVREAYTEYLHED